MKVPVRTDYPMLVAAFALGMGFAAMLIAFIGDGETSADVANRLNVQHAVDACVNQGGTPTFGFARPGELATVNGCAK
jgi:hypothetical protein